MPDCPMHSGLTDWLDKIDKKVDTLLAAEAARTAVEKEREKRSFRSSLGLGLGLGVPLCALGWGIFSKVCG